MVSRQQLYQEIILDHFKNPRHQAPVSDADLRVEEYNPSCGDVVRLAFACDGEVLRGLHYEARGCAISVASASMMSTQLEGKSLAEARALVEQVLAALADQAGGESLNSDELAALMTVKNFPMRLKCATLPWVAMQRSL